MGLAKRQHLLFSIFAWCGHKGQPRLSVENNRLFSAVIFPAVLSSVSGGGVTLITKCSQRPRIRYPLSIPETLSTLVRNRRGQDEGKIVDPGFKI